MLHHERVHGQKAALREHLKVTACLGKRFPLPKGASTGMAGGSGEALHKVFWLHPGHRAAPLSGRPEMSLSCVSLFLSKVLAEVT